MCSQSYVLRLTLMTRYSKIFAHRQGDTKKYIHTHTQEGLETSVKYPASSHQVPIK